MNFDLEKYRKQLGQLAAQGVFIGTTSQEEHEAFI
jgi:hypothetical protein